MSNLIKNPGAFQRLDPGQCCIEDVFVEAVEFLADTPAPGQYTLLLTLNDGTQVSGLVPNAVFTDVRVSNFTLHPDQGTDPNFFWTIRITMSDATVYDLDLRDIFQGAAGGDLQGNYPDPTLAPGAINNKVLVTPVAGDFILIYDATDGLLKKIDASTVLYVHPNHTGDVTSTGDGATVLQPVAINGQTLVTPVAGDFLLIWDATDSQLKKIDASALLYVHPNHTGEVTSTGDGATVLQPVAISNKTQVTPAGADYVLIWDATDSMLKKVLVSELVAVKNIQVTQTTDATSIILGTSLSIPNNSVVYCKVKAMAIQSAGAAGTVGDSFVHEYKIAIKNIAGTTSLVDTETDELIAEDAGAAAWTVGFAANDGTDALDITVTGEASKTIEWNLVTTYELESY